jgi:hypothetical protein
VSEFPKVMCKRCGDVKDFYLFSPGQRKRKEPICMMCRRKPRNGVKVMTRSEMTAKRREFAIGMELKGHTRIDDVLFELHQK